MDIKLTEAIDYWKEAPVWTPDTIGDATADGLSIWGNEGMKKYNAKIVLYSGLHLGDEKK